MALTSAGVPFEVVPGVTTAVAAPELAGIPLTHRGLASGFLVIAGHVDEKLDETLVGVRPNGVTIVVMMGLAERAAIAARLQAHGWRAGTSAAIICGASTPDAWIWTGTLNEVGAAVPPPGVPGVLVVGEVVRVREALNVARELHDAQADDGESTSVGA